MLAKVFLLICVAFLLSGASFAQDEESQDTLPIDSIQNAGIQAKAEARGGLKSVFDWARRRTRKNPSRRRYYSKYPRAFQQNSWEDQDDTSQIENFPSFIRYLRSLKKKRPRNYQVGVEANTLKETLLNTDARKAITENMAEKEGVWDLYTIGKKLYKAYKAYQDGVASTEDFKDINEDIDRIFQQKVIMAGENFDGDELAEEEAIFTIPTLLYNAYKGYKLYKKYAG